MKKMNPELKAKWVAALRSGEYKQGKGALLNDYGELCCIGVFGRICGVSDEVLLSRADVLGSSMMPELDAIDHDKNYGARNMLANMNDSGKTFPEIADWIEANL